MSKVRMEVNDNFFSSDSPESFYWAGFIAADGCVKLHNHKYKILYIGLGNVDSGHLCKFKSLINFSGNIHMYSKHSEISIRSDKIFDSLSRFNIVPRKSLILTFPEWIMENNLVNHFMRGYNDGDGSFFTQNLKNGKTIKQLIFSLRGTKEFLSSYKNILEKKCDVGINDKKPRKNSGIYMLEYGGNRKVQRIRDFLYKDANEKILLDRKFNIVFSDEFVLPESFKFKSVISTDCISGEEKIFKSIKDAVSFGFLRSSISDCCRGKLKFHKGFTWRYAY